jgi:transposase
VYISRSTMCDWVKATAELLRPLYDLQCKLSSLKFGSTLLV